MPHRPDIAAQTRLSHTIDEAAADMARYTTMRPGIEDAVREILPIPGGRPAARQAVRQPMPSPTARRRGSWSVIRGAQTRATAVHRPLRIPGR